MHSKLTQLRNELKVGKNHFNSFGKYKYRNLEDILDAVKPLLTKYGLALVISDEVKEVGGVIFVEATATIKDENTGITAKAQAGIDINKKGMDMSQTFGASSSYARKYACNALFLIDDVQDADSTNKHGKGAVNEDKQWLNKGTEAFKKAKKFLQDGGDIQAIKGKYNLSKEVQELLIK